MRLPPGVKSKDFSDALKQFAETVGKQWVFMSDEDVDPYRDSYSPVWNEPEEPIPSAAVAPDSVDQVQAIVRIANKYKIPLWTATAARLRYWAAASFWT
jgi:FAD/FMN-containing dehydrogenase